MAVKSINDSAGPNGLVPTLLVFGALPCLGLPTDQPTPSTFNRAVALRKAIESMSRHFASRQVCDTMASRNGPNVADIHQAPIRSKVLVHRPALDRWDGPLDILTMDGEDITVLLLPPEGPSKFRSTAVKPLLRKNTSAKASCSSNTFTHTFCNVFLCRVLEDIRTSEHGSLDLRCFAHRRI